jgi:hypothetical protein
MPQVAKSPEVVQPGTRTRSVPLTGTDPETRYQTTPVSFFRRVLEQFLLGVFGPRNTRRYRELYDTALRTHRQVAEMAAAAAREAARQRETNSRDLKR